MLTWHNTPTDENCRMSSRFRSSVIVGDSKRKQKRQNETKDTFETFETRQKAVHVRRIIGYIHFRLGDNWSEPFDVSPFAYRYQKREPELLFQFSDVSLSILRSYVSEVIQATRTYYRKVLLNVTGVY